MKSKMFEREKNLQSIYRKLFCQMVITAALYAVIGVAAYLVIIRLLERVEIVHSLLSWVELHRVSGFFAYIVIGYTVILIYYWKKPFSYLNDILTATSSIYQQDDKSIILPAPLETIENYLNELRSDVQESKLAAQNAEQRKNDMISYLAHDLKTPLTSIIGYLSLMNDTPDMSMEERAKCGRIAVEKAQRLEKMINEFFDITQYNLQQVELEKETIDLTGFLLSFAIEVVQMFGRGSTDINDLITNTVGTCLGYFLYKWLSKLARKEVCEKCQTICINEYKEILFFVIYSFVIMVTIQPFIIHTFFGLG